jgi:hypothetical protein
LRGAVVIAAISGAVVAVADPSAGGDLNADTRALVAQLTAERAITLAKERRLADAAQEELSRRLAAEPLARSRSVTRRTHRPRQQGDRQATRREVTAPAC